MNHLANTSTSSELDLESIDPKEILTISKLEHDHSTYHNETRNKIATNMSYVSALALFNALGYTLRCTILVLYMRTFYDNNSVISAVTFASCIFAGIDSLIQASIADKWRFDTLIVIATICDIITFSFEAGAWNFIVVSTAYIVSGQPISALVQGYLARMLPVKDSKEKVALFYQYFTLSYVFGPGLGGVIAYFTSYRAVFWIATGITALSFVFATIFIHNRQKTFETSILALKDRYKQYPTIDGVLFAKTTKNNDNNDEENNQLIPLKQNEISNSCKISYFRDESINNGKNIENISSMNENLKWLILDDYRFQLAYTLDEKDAPKTSETEAKSRREWFIMSNMILQNGIHYGVEASWSLWYTAYLKDKYDSSIIISTSQLTVLAFFIIIGMQSITVLGDKLKKAALVRDETNDNNSYSIWWRLLHVRIQYDARNVFVVLLTICYVILIVLSVIVVPFNIIDPYNNDSYIYTFWFYLIIFGFFWGIAAMTQEMIILEVQPKNLTGRVNGIKMFVMMVLRGIIGLIIGLLWDFDYEWFWFMQGISFGISIILLAILAITEA